MGFLRIVLTATSLALGVNMPCKSSVFIGNSVELTPLMFRQTSGRAGRRGYDNLGYIVFWNLPFSKIQRLVGSQLSVLSGEFPVSPTVVLRTMQLQQELAQQVALESNVQRRQRLVDDHSHLTEALVRMYTVPLFSVSSRDSKPTDEEVARMSVMAKYSVRFSIDHLQRRCVLDSNGELDGYNSIDMAIFDREPANLILHDLLVSGGLHNLLESQNTSDPIALLLHVLAYFFHTVPVSYATVKRIEFGGFVPDESQDATTIYRPLLPPLPNHINIEIARYNKRILENSTSYVRAMSAFSNLSDEADDYKMPYSGIDFNRPSSPTSKDGTVKAALLSQLLPDSERNARSPFAALCGRPDSSFLSAEDLIANTRAHVYLEQQMVPVVDHDTAIIPGGSEPVPLINSYILDFFREKTLGAIIRRNAIDSSQAWYLIHDWKVSADALTRVMDLSVMRRREVVPNAPTESTDPFCVQFREINNSVKKLADAIGA